MSDAAAWYARKLGNNPPRQQPAPLPPHSSQPQAPAQQAYTPPAQQQEEFNGSYSQAIAVGDRAGGQQTQRLIQKVAQERCPECGSSDYLKPRPENVPRCFSCGYAGGRFPHQLG